MVIISKLGSIFTNAPITRVSLVLAIKFLTQRRLLTEVENKTTDSISLNEVLNTPYEYIMNIVQQI